MLKEYTFLMVISIIALFINIPLVYSGFGIDGTDAIKIQKSTTTSIVTFNNNTASVNSSAWWGSYLYTLYDMNLIKGYAYNQTPTGKAPWLWYDDNLNFNESKLNNSVSVLIQTAYYNATSNFTLRGTPAGVIGAIQIYDDKPYNVTEVAGVDGLDFRLNFTGVTSFNQIITRYRASAGETHTMILQVYDYDDADWEDYATYTDNTAYNVKSIGVYDPASHISGNLVQLRFYMADNGNTNHIHYFDWVSLAQGVAISGGTEVDPYSYHTDENINASGYNITASSFNAVDKIMMKGSTTSQCIGSGDICKNWTTVPTGSYSGKNLVMGTNLANGFKGATNDESTPFRNNIIVGNNILINMSNSSSLINNNVFVGTDMAPNFKGTGTTCMGVLACGALVTGTGMQGFGYNSMNSVTSGANSISFGQYALAEATTSYDNNCFGYGACGSTTGWYNTMFGSYAGRYTGNGEKNFYGGFYTGEYFTNSDFNTFAGYYSGRGHNTTHILGADYNTYLGALTGYNNTGDRNVFLGYLAGSKQRNVNDKLMIDNTDTNESLIWGDFANRLVTINGFLNVTGNDSSDISIWASKNISATGFITRTSVFEATAGKTTMDYIKNASYYKTNGVINESKFYGYTKMRIPDYSRPVIEERCYEVENWTEKRIYDEANEVWVGKDKFTLITECTNYTKYPFYSEVEGVELGSEIDVLRQAVYEKDEQIKLADNDIQSLKNENAIIKSELCKVNNAYAFCK